ncbi:MAG: acyl-CoA thioesterase [Flavobacteriales bacterium]|mgnify:FL=1|nr:acyl-CoA thioesterase [Flavobacteriales bacterium]MBT6746328.1 acyl-CoA thioesterase [Flavobacteriales bacterium]
MKHKKSQESRTTTTKLVLPNEGNQLGNLFGGQLMAWMDEIAAISAHRHSNRVVVTASVNNISFNYPIKVGDIVTLEAQVSRAFSTSMEIYIDVNVEHPSSGKKIKCNEAIYTFVAIDQIGTPIEVPGLIPETDLEKKRFASALRRRELSLILGGKMKPSEATELKSIFE